jgi:hypothetical protein
MVYEIGLLWKLIPYIWNIAIDVTYYNHPLAQNLVLRLAIQLYYPHSPVVPPTQLEYPV